MVFQFRRHTGSPESQQADRSTLGRIPRRYDAAMNARVFGYQSRCAFCAQNDTAKIISGEIKLFADTAILENKIPDNFARTGPILDRWKAVTKYMAPQ
jgi:hypothetical protein